jgi:hypothetical protein
MVEDIEVVVVHVLRLEIDQQTLALLKGQVGLETDTGAVHRVGLGSGADRGLRIRAVRQPERVAVAIHPAKDRKAHFALVGFCGVGRKLALIRPVEIVDSLRG